MSSPKRRGSELLEVARKFRAAPSATDTAIYQFLNSLDTPRALTVWLLYKSKEHDQLTQLECNAADYENDPYRFRLDYCATNFLSKASFLKTSFNREEVALKKFHEYEALCAETNRRFRRPSLDPLNHGSNVWLLNATKRKIAEILGDFCGDEFVDEANWGPGVSTLVKGEHVSAINKFHAGRGITRELYSLVGDWFHVAYPSWSASLSREYGENWQIFEDGNAIVTVPKNSKTDRVIAIEPDLNLWFQKAVGSMIRRRLRRSGINLQDQGINQELARIGSKDQTLATVDFSSASDSISLEVVRELLPPRWFLLMDSCRSRFGKTTSGSIRWEKFSSMGNGFTFELESLIFFAAAQAVKEFEGTHGQISVYGDDVIIPAASFNLFSSFSAFLGFRVNKRKSFALGYFKESCGSHFYDGVDCKPIFLKEKLSYVEAFYKLANSVRLLSHRYGSYSHCDDRFLDCWRHLFTRVPEPLRLFVPIEAGDTGFVGNFDEACPVRARYGIEGYQYRALGSRPLQGEASNHAVILARLNGMSTKTAVIPQSRGRIQRIVTGKPWQIYKSVIFSDLQTLPDMAYGNQYALRGRTARVVTNPLVRQWYDLGPWW